jgi:predicted Zn-ribbon and HTH transcriptional regulator
MNISRQTLGNILSSAHKKIADAIVNGKIIRIEGGKVEIKSERNFVCEDCGHSWTLPFGTGRPENCPKCESENIHRADSGRRHRGRMRQRRRNQNK